MVESRGAVIFVVTLTGALPRLTWSCRRVTRRRRRHPDTASRNEKPVSSPGEAPTPPRWSLCSKCSTTSASCTLSHVATTPDAKSCNDTEALPVAAPWADGDSMAPVERRWDELLTNYDQFTILVYGTFLLHETVYFTRFIPFWICDHIPFLRKYKIQQVRGRRGPASCRLALMAHDE